MTGAAKRVRAGRKPRVGADRAVTYRLYPTAVQERGLVELLGCQRELYNAALEERRGAWRWERRSVSKYEQYGQLTGSQELFGWLARFGVGLARGTLTRVDEAMAGFFRRVEAGHKPGFPRFKGPGSFDSVQWEGTVGWRLAQTGKGSYGRLYLQGVGKVSVKVHRWFEEGAECRKVVVRRRAGRWEATVFWRGVKIAKPPSTGRAAGVDVGVAVLAAVATTGPEGCLPAVERVVNPHALARVDARLGEAQRAKAATVRVPDPERPGRRRDSVRRRRAKTRSARLHRRAANLRREAAHQLSARLVAGYDLIAVERLDLGSLTASAKGTVELPGRNVAAKSGLNRSILDAGWGQLVRMVAYKAASAGRQLVRINASYTSQTCASCGQTDPASRVSRDRFCCLGCGHQAHADDNAAQVIVLVATGALTIKAPKRPRPRPGSGHSPATAGRDAA